MQKFLYVFILLTINATTVFGDISNSQESIKHYNAIVKLKPSDAEAHFAKGLALGGSGKYEQAIECFDKAIKLKADYFEAYNNKGVALNNLGKYEQAIEFFDKALELDPGDTIARDNIQQVLDKLKQEE